MSTIKYKKILVVSLHRLGDNIQVSPLLKVLKEKNPDTELHIFTESGFESVFDDNPFIDKIHLFYRSRYSPESFISLKTIDENSDPILASLKKEGFDLLINRQSSREGALLAGVIPAAEKRGYCAGTDGNFTVNDPWTRLLFAIIKKREHNPWTLSAYSALIGGGSLNDLSFFIAGDDTGVSQIVSKINVQPGERLVAIQTCASTPYRQWEPESFSRLAELLLERQCVCVLIGSPGEAPLLNAVAADVRSGYSSRLYVKSDLSLKLLPAFLKRCDLLITNDTGPMNYGMAAGVRILCLLFGGSLINETGPWGTNNVTLQADLDCVPCTPLQSCDRQFLCKDMLRPEAVAAAALWQLGCNEVLPSRLFSDIKVYRSVTEPGCSGVHYLPLFKPRLSIDLLTRYLYEPLFINYCSDSVFPMDILADRLRNYFSDAKEFINGPIDFDLGVVDRFSTTAEEATLLRNRFVGHLTELRGIL
jgi:heptosyltransferase-2